MTGGATSPQGAVEPQDGATSTFRRYVDNTMVLETIFQTKGGEARLLECFVINAKDERSPYHQLLRIVEGTRGHVKFRLRVVPRFDYGEVDPWLRYHGRRVYSATGGDDALVVSGDPELAPSGDHDLEAVFSVSLVAVLITHDRFVSLLTYAIPALSDSRQRSKG
jgi:GH15 family glucan-1,4-alpha-glucosidase